MPLQPRSTLCRFAIRRPTVASIARLRIVSPVFFHVHTFGETFYVEQQASIVAAYVDEGAKRAAEAQDEKRHRINPEADRQVALLCSQIGIFRDAHALGDGRD